jgi:hypothetical protein
MPVYDFIEKHQTDICATPEQVFEAIRTADLAGSPVTRTLLALRALPGIVIAVFRSPGNAPGNLRDRIKFWNRDIRLSDFEKLGFRVVAEEAPKELVIGLMGKFWTLRGGLYTEVTANHFEAGPSPGYALAGWNFTVTEKEDGNTKLCTETRVLCSQEARNRFRAYWFLVRPGSGLIRRVMLRSIRHKAEHPAA